jgi:hypothetical protein
VAGADHLNRRRGRRRRGGVWSAAWWRDALERSVRAAAGAALAVVAGDGSGVVPWADWRLAAGVGAAAMVVSMLVSLAAAGVGDPESASFRRP